MKKTIIIMALLCATFTQTFAQAPYVPENAMRVYFAVTYQWGIIDEGSLGEQTPRTPVQPPTAYIENHTLFIYGGNRDFDLQILSDDGAVVYTTYVASGVNEVELPSTLSGDYLLQLEWSDFVFSGEIEL